MPSSVIAHYTYDPEIRVLTVTFVSGLVYQYLEVPGEVYLQMKNSFSKGIFLNKNIKGSYEYRKLNNRPRN
jgi:hypothetical protein